MSEKIGYRFKNGKVELLDASFQYEDKGIQQCIQNYVDGINKVLVGVINEFPNVEEVDFFLLFHGASDLDFTNDRYKFGQELFMAAKSSRLPCIHLTLYDVFFHNIAELPNQHYKKIIDSSIWNYYVPLDKQNGDAWEYNDNYEAFINALTEIAHNTQRGLYGLAITNEYADLNARLVEQSHLNGAHSAISPFVFHSEREMQKRIISLPMGESKSSQKVIDRIKDFKWRFLLIDDKGVARLKLHGSDGISELNKSQIVFDALSRILKFDPEQIWFRNFEEDNKCVGVGKLIQGKYTDTVFPQSITEVQIVIDCVPNIKTAEECLKKNEYEVILLDYLLDKEYGYDLLEKLRDWNEGPERSEGNFSEGDYLIGPNRRCFFMFISAFATAVNERLLEKGYNKSVRKLWYIGDGACPTNTPYLFAYQLLLRMEHRIKDLSKESEGNNITVVDLLNNIYAKSSVVNEVRDAARKCFNHVLFMRDKYHKLEKDLSKDDERTLKGKPENKGKEFVEMKSSFLVYSAFNLVHHFSGAFFEHLQHLVYLTAFGTIRQWEDMWEEYIFVRKELEEYDVLCDDQNHQGGEISRAIRDYIINLKENNY